MTATRRTCKPSQDKARELGVRCSYLFIGRNVAALNGLTALVDCGKVRPIVGAEFARQDMKLAHALSESGRAKGKIALVVASL